MKHKTYTLLLILLIINLTDTFGQKPGTVKPSQKYLDSIETNNSKNMIGILLLLVEKNNNEAMKEHLAIPFNFNDERNFYDKDSALTRIKDFFSDLSTTGYFKTKEYHLLRSYYNLTPDKIRYGTYYYSLAFKNSQNKKSKVIIGITMTAMPSLIFLGTPKKTLTSNKQN